MNEHVFVIRIWWEYREIEGELPSYRGVIQHVETGKKQYFKDLGTIQHFITSFLGEMQDQTHLQWPLKTWSSYLKRLSNI
ncbi:MAG: hypothetical protein R3E31_12790 [Chloroflexota bacterium]|nr:hypothetical protein [Anaerolineales bacterium]